MLSLYHHTHTFLFLIVRHHPTSTLFPYTTLFRSLHHRHPPRLLAPAPHPPSLRLRRVCPRRGPSHLRVDCLLSRRRSEEHTSELQSPYDLVCRLLLEKKKKNKQKRNDTLS